MEANPGPDERGDAAGASRRRRHASVDRRPGDVGRRPPAAWPTASGRRRRPGRRRGARGRHRLGQPRPAVRRAGRDAGRLDRDARRGARPRARPPVALRPDPRRSGRRRADRPGRRPPADDPGARRWRDDRPAAPGRGPGRRASTTTPSTAWPARAGAATRSAIGRDPGHESRHNAMYWERRPFEAVGPGAHAFDGATRRWNAARLDGYLAALTPPDRRPRRGCRRAVRRRSTSRPRRPRP